MPQERPAGTTLKGNPFTLIGPELKAGNKAPGFTVVGNDLKDVTLASTAGKVRLISVVPSLDTPVCDARLWVAHTRTESQILRHGGCADAAMIARSAS